MNTLKFLFLSQLKHSQPTRKATGFTLIELLVALIMAALIITPVLGFMVNLLQTERQEQAKATSEQEIQAAANYIARDLQQAVYIYDAEGLNNTSNNTSTPGIQDQIPPQAPATGCDDKDDNPKCIPVLVFWKREVVKNVVPYNASATCPNECDDAFIYSLVAYYLIQGEDANDPTWSEAARIGRFEISGGVERPTYLSGTGDIIAKDEGFQLFDTSLSGSLHRRMNQWKKDLPDYDKKVDILVDYIDNSTANVPQQTCPPNTTDDPWTPVPNYGATADSANGTVTPQFQTYSFYSCVNWDDNTAKVYLRGNALARIHSAPNQIEYKESRSSYFPTASIEVKGIGGLSSE